MKAGRRLLTGLGAALLLGTSFWAPWSDVPTVHVSTYEDLQEALDSALPGTVVLLEPGRHEGGVRVEKKVTLRGLPGATISAPSGVSAVVSVSSDETVIEDLILSGGSSGLVVREAEGVVVRDVRVVGSDLHGIEVVDAAAEISSVRVAGLVHPMAQGIEVRNSDGRPDTVIQHSSVSGGQEGVVSHVSEVIVRDNHVSGTSMRAITVTEMSDGVVEGNTIADALGAGLYCGDMSRCQFSDNTMTVVAPGSAGRSTEGWGLVVTYHAAAFTDGDALEGAAGEVLASIGGHLRDDSPLDPTATSSAWAPVLIATVAAVVLLWVAYRISRRSSGLLDAAQERKPRRIKAAAVWPLLLAGLAVQAFHMIEHGLQVFRVRIDQIPSRGGIVGPTVEGEWVHFIYNVALLAGIVFVSLARRRGWRPRGNRPSADALLLVAVVVQGYHAVEHSAKLIQHLTGGAKVNPGFAGHLFDLVLFHYAINLTVFLAMIGVALFYGEPAVARLKERGIRRAIVMRA